MTLKQMLRSLYSFNNNDCIATLVLGLHLLFRAVLVYEG